MLCPFKNPELKDRGLRATYFAVVLLKATVPNWHPHLDCMMNCMSKVRDISEVVNCWGDFQRVIDQKLVTSKRQHPYAQRLHQVARILGLFSSAVTPFGIACDWGLLRLGKYNATAGFASRVLSAGGHIFAATSLFIDFQERPATYTTNKAIDSLSECTYMILELVMESTPESIQGVLGVTTACWGIYKNTREELPRN